MPGAPGAFVLSLSGIATECPLVSKAMCLASNSASLATYRCELHEREMQACRYAGIRGAIVDRTGHPVSEGVVHSADKSTSASGERRRVGFVPSVRIGFGEIEPPPTRVPPQRSAAIISPHSASQAQAFVVLGRDNTAEPSYLAVLERSFGSSRHRRPCFQNNVSSIPTPSACVGNRRRSVGTVCMTTH